MRPGSTVVRGIGVHGGRPATVQLFRRDGPVRLRRGGREVAPRFDAVVATRGATVLGDDGVRIATVEHLLAALHVRAIWSGLLIEVDGDELPILDGSAAPWDEALAELGPFPAAPEPLPPDAEAEARRADGGVARLQAGPRWIEATVAFDHPAIGRQRWSGGPDAWPALLPARTFGFAADVEALRAAGLARGAGPENAIVFGDDGPLQPLRFPDEPVRHKALDALGDLYLAGRPFHGTLRVERAGHDLHVRLARMLTERDRDRSTTGRA
jgi:UDP-3-O-[3-hydroxymyristoyl] N-acetylglucosamine deacetylase